MKKLTLLLGLLLSGGLASGQSNSTYYSGTSSKGNADSFFGRYAGQSTPTGYSSGSNVGVGYYALENNNSNFACVAIGARALENRTASQLSVGIGYRALAGVSSSNSYFNVAVGSESMLNNSTGSNNAALGFHALRGNTTGDDNVAVGYRSLTNNTEGNSNVALGVYCMGGSGGSYNTATGTSALGSNLGSYNTASGYRSLRFNTTGRENVAVGSKAAEDNTTGIYNTAVGSNALNNNKTGLYNTVIGSFADFASGTSYSFSSAIGSQAKITASHQVRVAHSWVSSIGGYQNWTNVSDGRFKEEVKENVMGLAFINELRPVSYHLNVNTINKFLGLELDEETKASLPKGKNYQTGFIAQEVEATAKKLGFDRFHGVDAPKNENDHYGLRYAEFVVPLVKSVQELSAQNEELKAAVAQQQAQINQLLAAQQMSTEAPITKGTSAQLYQNVPNPHQGQTQIKVVIPETSRQAFLQVTDLSGKQLILRTIDALGESVITLQTNDLEAGMYLYTLVVDQQVVATKKMVVAQ